MLFGNAHAVMAAGSCGVVCSVLQPGAAGGPTSQAAFTALEALEAFFNKSGAEGGLWPETDNDRSRSHPSGQGSRSSSSPKGLAPTIRSQVLQSGLMEILAPTMTAAADSISTATLSDRPVGSQTQLWWQIVTSALWLTIWTYMCHLWPSGRERLAVIAAAAPAAVQLSATIMQVVSRDLPVTVKAAAAEAADAQTGAGSQGTSTVADGVYSNTSVLYSSVQTVLQVVGWLAHGLSDLGDTFLSMPELQPLLVMPEFTTALATMLVVSIEALLARQKLGPTAAATASRTTTGTGITSPGPTGSSSGRAHKARQPASSSTASTNSSSSSATISGTDKAAAKLNRKLEAVLKNLPECTKALLETLGMDSRAIVWAAAAQRDVAEVSDLDRIAVTLVSVLCWQPEDAAAAVPTTLHLADEGQMLQKLLLQVPAVLLHWLAVVASQRKGGVLSNPVLDEQQVLLYGTSFVFSSHQCTQTWLKLTKTANAQNVDDRTVGLQGSSEIDALASEPWLQPYFPAVWLEQVLPDAQQLLAVLLPYCWQQQATSTASQSVGAASAAAALLQRESVGQPLAVWYGSEEGSRTVPLSVVWPEVPGRLVVLQCQALQLAVGNTYAGYRVTASKFATDQAHSPTGANKDSVLNTCGSSNRLHRLTKPLAEFRGVNMLQTLASFEGFIRASAQQLATGRILDPIAQVAISAVNATLLSNEGTEPGPLLSQTIAAGPGSPEQQQLYSLLSSLLKLSALGANSTEKKLAQFLSHSCIITAQAAIQLLEAVHKVEGPAPDSSSSGTVTQQQPAAAISLSGAAASSSTAVSTSAVALLPGLVMVGRCCLLWAQHLHEALPQVLEVREGVGGLVWLLLKPQDAARISVFSGWLSASAAAALSQCVLPVHSTDSPAEDCGLCVPLHNSSCSC